MPTLRDIYRYFGGHTGGVGSDQPWSRAQAQGDDGWVNPAGSSFDRTVTRAGGEGGGGSVDEWAIRPESFLAQLNAQYGEGTAQAPVRRRGNDQEWVEQRIDFSRLPRTRFGSVENTVPIGPNMRLNNPDLVYDDPNYGRITVRGNQRSRSPYLGPALMALVSMGMGPLIGAAGGAGAASTARTAMAALRGLQGLGEGNWTGALTGAAGAFGVPSWATSLARLGMSYRNRPGG